MEVSAKKINRIQEFKKGEFIDKEHPFLAASN